MAGVLVPNPCSLCELRVVKGVFYSWTGAARLKLIYFPDSMMSFGLFSTLDSHLISFV